MGDCTKMEGQCPTCKEKWTRLGSPSLEVAYSWCSNCGTLKIQHYESYDGDARAEILSPKIQTKEGPKTK